MPRREKGGAARRAPKRKKKKKIFQAKGSDFGAHHAGEGYRRITT